MSLKKIIIFGIIGYAIVGFFLLSSGSKNKETPGTTTGITGIFNESDVVLTWDIKQEKEGTYKAPVWLKNANYIHYVEENDFAKKSTPTNFSSQFQLMSLIAQLQLGDPTLAYSYIAPEYAYAEYETRDYDVMKETSEGLASAATKNYQLTKVEILSGKSINDLEISHPVRLYFNEEVIEITVPMKFVIPEIVASEHYDEQDDHTESLWMVNQTLTDFTLLVERASQN